MAGSAPCARTALAGGVRRVGPRGHLKFFYMGYILASASPRRRELLKQILPQFRVIPAVGAERADLSLLPEQIACSLAESKCAEVSASRHEDTVIGCDTIVVFDGEILGKPADAAEAAATLRRLSGRTHFVITGVCVRRGEKQVTGYDRTEVRFNALSEEFIADYVAGGSPLDKAGSYGIQDEGVVREYFGSYTNVVGLPVALVKELLEKISK